MTDPSTSKCTVTNVVDLTNDDISSKEKENVTSNINKRNKNATYENVRKKIKLHKVDYSKPEQDATSYSSDDIQIFIEMMKKNLEKESFEHFCKGLAAYKESSDIKVFIQYLNEIFRPKPHLRYLIQGNVKTI